MPKLRDYALNVYSQNGEDGILGKIFEIIDKREKKSTNRVCIEFGAWDGFHLSNTANLWTRGWKGILIEADKKKYKQLVNNVKEYPCSCINDYVSYPAHNTLERILERNNIKDHIDFLSIDIDGDDYYVFESLKKIKPTVVCCEFNPTIPFHVSFRCEQGKGKFGCSALSLVQLAENKGYKLIAVTATNCIFVLNKYFNMFSMYDTALEELQKDFKNMLNYVLIAYDGRHVLLGSFGYGFMNEPYTGKLITGDEVFREGSLKGSMVYKFNPMVGIFSRALSKFIKMIKSQKK